MSQASNTSNVAVNGSDYRSNVIQSPLPQEDPVLSRLRLETFLADKNKPPVPFYNGAAVDTDAPKRNVVVDIEAFEKAFVPNKKSEAGKKE